jgi:hypothetical protein
MQIAPISNLQITDMIARWDMFKAVGLAEARAVPRIKEILKSAVIGSAMQAAARIRSRVADPSMCWNGIGAAVSDRENRANLTFKAFKKLAASPWGRAGRARSGLGRGRVGM